MALLIRTTNQLKKRIALVTGATGGLGTAITKKLIDDGYTVVGTYKTEEKAITWIKMMAEDSYEPALYKLDVRDFDETGRVFSTIQDQVGPIDILVNNAGLTRDGVLRKMTKDSWDEVIGANLTSVFNCSRHVINGMIERGYGRIIMIGSVNSMRGQVGQTNYSAAKAGMHGFAKSLAVEVAGKGITVNTVSPGYIETDIVNAIPLEIIQQKILPSIPVGRLGGTSEVAYLVSFLASEQASFITGSNYSINGGQHMY